MQLYRKWLPVAACYNTCKQIESLSASGDEWNTTTVYLTSKAVVVDRFLLQWVNKQIHPSYSFLEIMTIRDVGSVMASPIIILQFWYPGVKYLRMRWRHSPICATVTACRLHCISNLRNLAFFIDTFLCIEFLCRPLTATSSSSSGFDRLSLPQSQRVETMSISRNTISTNYWHSIQVQSALTT